MSEQTAYVVTSGDYSAYRIHHVFGTKAAAEAYIAISRSSDDLGIEEYPMLTEPGAARECVSAGGTLWDDGTWDGSENVETVPEIDGPTWGPKYEINPWRNAEGRFGVSIQAWDWADKARKALSEMLAQARADFHLHQAAGPAPGYDLDRTDRSSSGE